MDWVAQGKQDSLPVFKWLRYTPYVGANGGEECWMAVLDRESQERIYKETQAEWAANHESAGFIETTLKV